MRKIFLCLPMCATIIALLLTACTSPNITASPALVPATGEDVPATPPVAVLGDPQELETFIDGVMNKQLEEQYIAGAVVVIVKDGQALLSKGYGYADVEKLIPVDPENTLFRPGSVTKLFTWTAVMQLVEQGKIDLNADINTYLKDFQIPTASSKPISMLDLMSHTAGFGETGNGDATYNAEELTSLGVYLARDMPALAYPPGQVPAYSNYGATLAGHIIEQVSGEPYDQYIEAHILKPLGMAHSTLHQPLPAQLAVQLSHSYMFNEEFQDVPFLFLQVSPAGALNASGGDMGKFMLAHLQDGEFNGARILKPETARLMHSQSYTFDPALTGIAHGFAEWTINGRRLIGHGGHVPEFITEMRLIPEEHVGLYVSYNTYIFKNEDRTALVEAFMDHYYPTPPAAQLATALTGREDAHNPARYTGFYVSSRLNSIKGPEKFFALVDMMLVRSGPSNTLLFPGVLFQQLSPHGLLDSWVEIRPRVFQNTRNGDLMVFKEDEQGQVRYLALDNNSYLVYIKQPWYGGQDIYLGILVLCLLTFLLTVIIALVGWFISLLKRGAGERSPWQSRLARGVALALSLAFIALIVAFIQNMNAPNQLVIRTLAWVVAALAVCVILLSIAVWWRGWWGLAGRLHYTVVALGGLAFTWFLAYWSVLVLP